MAAVADIVDDVIGIDEICYRAHRTRGQLAIWREQPDFPEPQKTKYGLIGYSWREVVNWMVGNQHWIRHRAHHPSLDELVASVKTSPPRPTLDDGGAVAFADVDAVADPPSASPTSSLDTADRAHATSTYGAKLRDRHPSSRGCAPSDLRKTD